MVSSEVVVLTADGGVEIGPTFGSHESAEFRKLRVGASEVAAVFGRSRWETAYGLAAKKLGMIASNREASEHQQLGHDFEEAVVKVAARRLSLPFVPNNRVMWRPLLPWLCATPDAICQCPETGGIVICNAKTSAWRYRDHFGDEGTDELPEEYLLQAQAEMAVTGAVVAHYPVMFDARTVRMYRVDRNESLIGVIVDRTEQFVALLREGRLPAIDTQHPSAMGAVKAVYRGLDDPPVIELSEDHEESWKTICSIRDEVGKLEAMKDALTVSLLVSMENATLGRFPSGAAVRRVVADETYVTQQDVDALAAKVGSVKRKGSVRLMAAAKTKEQSHG